MKVACVWTGKQYSIEYVVRLRNMVERHMTIPYELMVLTDNETTPSNTIKVRLPKATHTWWDKLELFNTDNFNKGERILYFDLDVVITNTLQSITEIEEPFTIIENFSPSKHLCPFNSSVMLWTQSDDTTKIYDTWTNDIEQRLHGDQDYIAEVLGKDKVNFFPKHLIVSYKYETRTRHKYNNDNTSVWIFHGEPKPHNIKNNHWISNNWR